jgi:AcrR family transcriptional regulator
MSVLYNFVSENEQSPSHLRVSPRPDSKITKSECTRTSILNAALDFIWERPFRDMSVGSLMASTVVSRSAFYQYFEDIHQLMKELLDMLAEEIFAAAKPWISGVGDPVALVNESLAGLIQVCYQRGPFLRAISDAATTDQRFEKDWSEFLRGFDEAAGSRIEGDQKQGLTTTFDPHPVAFALNRLDAYTMIEAFGKRPRAKPEPVLEALVRVWVSTLYGSEWVEKGCSNLVRT